jgi:large subunit ribosomal protein L32e
LKEVGKKGDKEITKLLELRRQIAERRPSFVRHESWRYKRLKPNWRKPKGVDNKVRKSVKGWPKLVKVGYRGPKSVRYLHPSGYREVLVHNLNELTGTVPGRDAVRIGSTVGAKKRAALLRRANELGLVILNPRGLRTIESKK